MNSRHDDADARAKITVMETSKQQESTDTFEMADTSVDPRPRRLFDMVCVIESLEDPFEYQRRTKWLVTSVVAIAAATSPMGASIFYRAYSNGSDINMRADALDL